MKLVYRLAALVVTFGAPAVAQTAPPPIEAYGTLPVIRSLAISPNGEKVAYLRVDESGEGLLVRDLETKAVTGARTDGVKTRSVRFHGDRHVILSASETTRMFGFRGRFEYSASFSFDTEDQSIKQLLRGEDTLYPAQSGLGRIVGGSADGKYVYMPAFVGDRFNQAPPFNLLRVNLDNGRARRFRVGKHSTIDWIVNKDGVVLARENLHNGRDDYSIETKRNGKWETIYEDKDAALVPFSLVGAKADESALIIIGDTGDGQSAGLFELGFDGAISEPILLKEGSEIDYVLTDRNRRVYGVAYSGMLPSYAFFDPTLTKAFEDLQAKYPSLSFRISSWTEDWSTVVVNVSGHEYFLFRPASGDLEFISSTLDVPREAVAPVDTIEYPARDGLKIPALLTWPVDQAGAENLPLIVMPHGGPESYDRVGFDWMAQYFASRGYLVFQPNFRGSSGFGADFSEAGYGEWGGKMQDDITDGVKALVSMGWADGDRACIVGASYGGYAALAGGAFTPDLYKCVAAIAPVSDLPRMLVDEARDHGRDHWAIAYWSKSIGDPREQRDLLKRVSPVNHADAFTAPVLLIHGKDDTVVPIKQSRVMRSALRKAGRDVELVELKGEDHNLSTGETRLETLKALDAFVERHIGSE